MSASNLPLPLFYKRPLPLDARAHRDLALRENFGFRFAENVNAVPINLIELPQICHFYPIAFSPGETATLVAILGLRDNENLFVGRSGTWLSNTYIPAYVRRYPFIFAEMPDSESLSLCVDYNEEAVVEGGKHRFFDPDGSPSQLSANALEFCKSYHAAAQQTTAFGTALAASGLLTDRAAQVAIHDGRRINFSGFRIIDETRLAEMSDKDHLDWRSKGWLPFIYAHLFSGSQWSRLAHLLNVRDTGRTDLLQPEGRHRYSDFESMRPLRRTFHEAMD